MIYLRSFKLSDDTDRNPNIYPDNVFKNVAGEVLLFDQITVLYGNNGSGKSTLLNVISNKLGISGAERMTSYGHSIYAQRFLDLSSYQLGHDEKEREIRQLPEGSRYMKSEDILYEIKKIQQASVLREGVLYEQMNKGMSKDQAAEYEARYFDSQFIIATHSPFVLGTLHAKIYNMDAKPLQTAEWYELDNVQFFYRFFNKHKQWFE